MQLEGTGQVLVACASLQSVLSLILAQQHTAPTRSIRHRLSLENMLVDEYPTPSYLADILLMPERWVEVPLRHAIPMQFPRILSADCEMVSWRSGRCMRSLTLNVLSSRQRG
jgi:hypothetical protein